MKAKTTVPGVKFVVGKVFTSEWFASFFINHLTGFMSTDMDLGRLPLDRIEISKWILRVEKLDVGDVIDLSPWRGLRGLYRVAQLLHRMQIPSFAEPLLKQANAVLPQATLDKIKENLEKSAVDEVNRLCNEALRKAGSKGTFDALALLAIIRAMQTSYRCIARYGLSPIVLIERAHGGDRQAVLDLIKVDKLFMLDCCTQRVLQKTLLSGDKSFNDQVARAQLFKPVFTRRHACELYMILLAGLQIKLPPYFKLKMILDPDRTTFPGSYDFQKCFERRKKLVVSAGVSARDEGLEIEGSSAEP